MAVKPSELFWSHDGPKISYYVGVPDIDDERGTLIIEDLNPEVKLTWRMTRWEMFTTGLKFVRAALHRPKPLR